MVYITGHSDSPVLLKVEDNNAELVDATDFWGLDIPQSQELAKERYGVQFATSFIGPGGENGVRWASVAGDTGRAAARGGSAAVLGHRKFKGIIAFGTQMTPVAEQTKIMELRRNYYNALYAWSGLEAFRRWGTLYHSSGNSFAGTAATKNHQFGETPYVVEAGLPYYQNEFVVRHRTCIGCITRCMKFGIVKTGNYKGTIYEGPDYEGAIMNGHDWLIKTGEEVAYLAEYVESQGLDCINTGGVVAFMIEAVEKGYLKSEQIDNIKLDWGATDEIKKLLVNIIHNTTNPIYDTMRKGAMPMIDWMVENNNCDEAEVRHISSQTKNNAFAAWWAGKASQGLNYALSTRGSCHMIGMAWGGNGGTTVIRDIGVFCTFGSQGGVSGYAYYEMLNATLGRNLTAEQWDQHGERTIMLEKCILISNGFRRRDDWPAERIFDPEPMTFDDGTPTVYGGQCLTRESLTQQIEDWYAAASVDPETSCPTRGKLQECGLDYVIPYIEAALAATGETLK